MKEAAIKYLKDKSFIITIIYIFIIRLTFYANSVIGITYGDSGSYINYSFRDGRVPIYPLFIQFAKMMFGENLFLKGTVLLQMLFSIVSLFYLYKILNVLLKKRGYALLMCAIYGSLPCVMGWDTVILTESLSISLCVIFIFYIIKYIASSKVQTGIICICLVLVMTFVKPSFLPFNYALMIFWILRFLSLKEDIRKLIPLLLGSGIALLIIAIYSYYVYQISGVFSITPLPARHLLAACLSSGIYESYPNQIIVAQINQIFINNANSIGYDTTSPIINLLGGNKKTLEFAKTCIQSNILEYTKYLLRLAWVNMNGFFETGWSENYAGGLLGRLKEVQLLLTVNWKIGYAYLFGFGELIATVYLFLKKKYISWIHFGLAGFLIGNLVFVFVGTYGDFGRNLIHLFPFLYISFCVFFSWLMDWVMGNKGNVTL